MRSRIGNGNHQDNSGQGAREASKAQAPAGHQDRTGLTKVLDGQPKGSNKERIAKPVSKPAKVAAQT